MARAPFKLRSQGSPFKEVGSTPKTEINLRGIVNKVKGSLSRLDKNLQERAVKHSEWKTKRKEKVADKAAASPDGLTNFQRRMADKKAQRESGGKSKYQRDIIKRRADRKVEKVAQTTSKQDTKKEEREKTPSYSYDFGGTPPTPPKDDARTHIMADESVNTPSPKIKVKVKTKKDKRPPGSSDSYQKKHKTGKYAVKTSQNKFRVQTSVNVDASGNTFPQSQGFKTKEEANSYMDANKGSFMYEVDKDGKRIKNTSSSNPSSKTSTSTAENKKKTSTKSRLTKIMQPGFMHIIDAMTKKKK